MAMKSNDFEQFSIALTKLAVPLSKEQCKKVKSATKGIRGPNTDSYEKPTDSDLTKTFPLPPEHEINQPFDESTYNEEGIQYYFCLKIFKIKTFSKSGYKFTTNIIYIRHL